MPQPATHKTLADMKGEERELDKEREKRKVEGIIVATGRPNLSLQYDEAE